MNTNDHEQEVKPHPPLTDADAWAIAELVERGDIEAAKRIVEGKGLRWLDSRVKKSHAQQPGA